MRLSHTLQPFVFLAGAVLPSVHAWGPIGHNITAAIAQIYIHPSVLPVLCNLLRIKPSDNSEATLRRECHLVNVATWADNARGLFWAKKMHYINGVDDQPKSNCQYPGPSGWAGPENINVLDAFKNVSRILGDWSGVNEHEVGVRALSSQRRRPGPLEEEAFKFLVHFAGDMHQPLHLTGLLSGGTNQTVKYRGYESTLHRVWDTAILKRLLERTDPSYSRPLPDRGNRVPSQQIEDALGKLDNATHRTLIRRVLWEGIEGQWVNETVEWVSCPDIPSGDVPPENPSLLSLLPTVFSDPLALPQKLLNVLGGQQIIAILPDGPVLCPYAWTVPIHPLNCRYAWNFTAFTRGEEPLPILNDRYFAPLDRDFVLEKLLAQGGLRLAHVLNWLFAEY